MECNRNIVLVLYMFPQKPKYSKRVSLMPNTFEQERLRKTVDGAIANGASFPLEVEECGIPEAVHTPQQSGKKLPPSLDRPSSFL